MPRRKRRKPKLKPPKPTVLAALQREPELRAAAARLGLAVRISIPVGGNRRVSRPTAHFQVNRGSARLADWWPSSGVWIGRTGRGIAATVEELVLVLRDLVGADQREPEPAVSVGAAGLVGLLAGQCGRQVA
jgi:hypothetical protein